MATRSEFALPPPFSLQKLLCPRKVCACLLVQPFGVAHRPCLPRQGAVAGSYLCHAHLPLLSYLGMACGGAGGLR